MRPWRWWPTAKTPHAARKEATIEIARPVVARVPGVRTAVALTSNGYSGKNARLFASYRVPRWWV